MEVSRSGSCEPIRDRKRAKGSAVPRIKDVPAVAIEAWVTDIIRSQTEWVFR